MYGVLCVLCVHVCVLCVLVLNYFIKPLYYWCPYNEQEESSRLLNSAWFLSTGTRDDTSYDHHSNTTVMVTPPISSVSVDHTH